jgi:non-ribosomal peptide synthetase component F
VALRLARRAGATGRVLATDLHTRFMAGHGQLNLDVHRRDITTDAIEPGSLDLAHTRNPTVMGAHFTAYDTRAGQASNCTMSGLPADHSVGRGSGPASATPDGGATLPQAHRTETEMTIQSPHPPVPLSGLRLTEFVLAHAAEIGDKPAIIDGATGRTLSYRELTASVGRCATALAHRGVTRGDVLALAGPNSPGYAVVFHAAAVAGAAVSTINPLAPPGRWPASFSIPAPAG